MSKTTEQALDDVVADTKAKQKQNARRLEKIHKLKRENRVLASKRNRLMNTKIKQASTYGWISRLGLHMYSVNLNRISEQIGRNSAKILRLRTLIKQSKL